MFISSHIKYDQNDHMLFILGIYFSLTRFYVISKTVEEMLALTIIMIFYRPHFQHALEYDSNI